MNIHNTLVEDIYNSKRGSMELSALDLPDIGDRAFWDDIDKDIREALISSAEAYLDIAFPQLTISDYREFSHNGDRIGFEDRYFLRRKMLVSLVLAECTENRRRFLDKILDGIYLILEESTWCIPAHNTYIRDRRQEEIPDESRPVIDLFAAETAEIIGLVEYLLRDVLEELSPYIGEYVNREIDKRILKPYLSYHFWWMGNGKEPMCNWTPWITQNVLLALFSRKDGYYGTDVLHSILKQAVSSVDYFLDEYEEDGCCDEGAQYYRHAGLCLSGCLDVLNRISHGGFAEAYDNTLVKNIALYIMKVYVGNDYYINYADCSPYAGRRSARDYLFAVNIKDEGYASFAAADYRGSTVNEKIMADEQNMYYHLLQLMSHRAMMEQPECDVRPDDVFFPSTGLLIARDDSFTLAVKAGDNGDSHNHNDVGSITLYKDNRPYLIDLGVETYTRKTFSPDRYEIWTMQSLYHNTVNFTDYRTGICPEIMQQAGFEHGARNTETALGDDRAYIAMDMTGAYADERIGSCIREVTFEKGKEIVVKDSFEVSDGIQPVLTFMTYEEPRVETSDRDTVQISVGKLGRIDVTGVSDVEIEVCPVTDERLKIAWKHDCYRILLYACGRSMAVRLG